MKGASHPRGRLNVIGPPRRICVEIGTRAVRAQNVAKSRDDEASRRVFGEGPTHNVRPRLDAP